MMFLQSVSQVTCKIIRLLLRGVELGPLPLLLRGVELGPLPLLLRGVELGPLPLLLRGVELGPLPLLLILFNVFASKEMNYAMRR